MVGRAVTTERDVPRGTAIPLVGINRHVNGRLGSLLDGRVLVNMNGKPLLVTNGQGNWQ